MLINLIAESESWETELKEWSNQNLEGCEITTYLTLLAEIFFKWGIPCTIIVQIYFYYSRTESESFFPSKCFRSYSIVPCNLLNLEIRQSTMYYAGLLGRRDKRIIDQASDVPNIIFFHDFLQNSSQKSFQFIFLFFYKITKIKIKRFECPKSIKSIRKWYLEHQTLGWWFICTIVQATQRNIL